MATVDIYERFLEAARALRGWNTPAEVARGLTRAGLDASASQLANWKTRGVSRKAMIKGSHIIGYDLHWLETGEGDMAPPKFSNFQATIPAPKAPEPNLVPNVAPAAVGFRAVPLISSVSAGKFCVAVDNFSPGDAEEWIMFSASGGPHTYALRVTGDSMTSDNPLQRSYPDGSIVIVDPEHPVTNGARVIAKLPNSDEVTFKVFKSDAGRRFLVPLNPSYSIIEMTDEMLICGVVIGGYWKE